MGSSSIRVFLCHSSGDKEEVRKLYALLKEDGYKPWFDEEDLEGGQDWQFEIPRAVRAADVVIVCMSRGALTKRGYLQKEIGFALDVAEEQPEGAIFIVPVRLEDCEIPSRLSRWQWVNLYEESGYKRLLRALALAAQGARWTASAAEKIVEDTGLPARDFGASARPAFAAPSHRRFVARPSSWVIAALALAVVGWMVFRAPSPQPKRGGPQAAVASVQRRELRPSLVATSSNVPSPRL